MKKTLLMLLLIISNCSIILSQDNYRLENFGNRSILLSGNVTGSVEDLGLTYYNPGRLALLDDPTFSINAKAYEFNQITLKNAVDVKDKLSSSRFNGVPSMIAGTFKIKSLEDHYFAYSAITKVRSNISLNYLTDLVSGDILGGIEGDEDYVAKVNLNDGLKDEWFGLTWSKAFSEKFSIGVTTFVSIYNHKGSNILDNNISHSEDEVVSYKREVYFEQSSYGMFWKIGLAWIYPKVEFGVNITPAYIDFYSIGKLRYGEFLAGGGSGSDRFTYTNLKDLNAKRKVPFGIDIGAGIPIRRSKLHLNLDWHNKLSSYDRIIIPEIESVTEDPLQLEFVEERKSVFNFGLGAEVYISPKMDGYLSFSSDYSSALNNSNIFDVGDREDKELNLKLDYYHFGFGINLKLSWSDMILGSTYSFGNSTFDKPDGGVPENGIDINNNPESASILLTRWRFIVGIEIPILSQKLKENESNQN